MRQSGLRSLCSQVTLLVDSPAWNAWPFLQLKAIKDAIAATVGTSASDVTITRYKIRTGLWQTYAAVTLGIFSRSGHLRRYRGEQ